MSYHVRYEIITAPNRSQTRLTIGGRIAKVCTVCAGPVVLLWQNDIAANTLNFINIHLVKDFRFGFSTFYKLVYIISMWLRRYLVT